MTQYLIETTITSVPHHSIWETQEDAFDFAGMKLGWWIREKRCSDDAAKEITALLEQLRYVEAMEAWNKTIRRPSIALCEIEFLAQNCHHEPASSSSYEDVLYVVEDAFDGISHHELFENNVTALEHAGVTLKHWTGKNPLFAETCDEITRQQVRNRLHQNNIAKAIDAWKSAKPNPTIAIHKIRLLRKGRQYDVA